MYRFISSSDLKDLAEEAGRLVRESLPSDPLRPIEMVVPNREHARWLSFRLAERNGISANIRYMLPSEWQWSQIRMQHPDLPDLLPSDPLPMAWSIWSLLGEEEILGRFPFIKAWLDRQGRARPLRQWQISRQISFVFDQYQVYRPEMMRHWERASSSAGKTASGSPQDRSADRPREEERWQQDLWRLLSSQWKQLAPKGLSYNRAELAMELISLVRSGRIVPERPVFFFNPGPLPPPVNRLMQEIGRVGEVYHFCLLSTSCFPVPDPGDEHLSVRASDSRDGDEPLEGEQNNPVFTAFGEEQTQLVRLLRRFAREHPDHVSIHGIAGKERGPHHLGRIQASILSGQTIPVVPEPDGSIEIRSCHSPLREVEVFKDYLIGLFSDRPDLRPEDVLVVTPDLNTWRPFLEAVFSVSEPGLPDIPFHIAGSAHPAGAASRALIRLLGMPDSRFGKQDILEFLQQTAISSRFRLSSWDLGRLEEWVDENRVVWGLNGEHRGSFDQPEKDLHTWDQAARRGWYGQLMAAGPGSFHKGLLLFSGIDNSDDRALWATFQHLMRRLSEVRESASSDRTVDEWHEEIGQWIDRFLPRGHAWEDEVRQIRQLVRQAVREMHTSGYTGKIPFLIIRECLLERLEQVSGGTTSFTRGMVVNSMVPVRSIPFRVIALLGLNEDLFPRRPVRADFDLMAGSARPGERDRKREDRNLFLESVMAAGEVHYSSYVGRNQKDDEPIPPSPILDEWIQIVARSCAADRDPVQIASLNGFSPRSFLGGKAGSWSGRYLNAARRIQRDDKLKGLEVDAGVPLPAELAAAVGLSDLEKFFRNPVRTFFSQQLGVRLEQPAGGEDQEFSLDALENHLLFERVFGWTLEGMEEKKMLLLFQQSGQLPEGWPGERVIRNIIESVRITVAQILERGYTPARDKKEISLKLGHRTLTGEIRSFSETVMLDVHLSGMSGKTLLQSWIRHLVLCASSPNPGFTTELLVDIKKGAPRWSRFVWEPEAEVLLGRLLDLYQKGMEKPQNLYIEPAFEYAKQLGKGEDKAAQKALAAWENDFTGFSERQDSYVELLLGKDAEADLSEIRQMSEYLYEPLVNNMNQKKG